MQDLLEAIRAAVADGATSEQKNAGAQACRTIFTALEAETGKPIALPGAPRQHPLAGLSFDQALQLAIARLTPLAEARDAKAKEPAALPTAAAPRIPLIPPPVLPSRVRTARRVVWRKP